MNREAGYDRLVDKRNRFIMASAGLSILILALFAWRGIGGLMAGLTTLAALEIGLQIVVRRVLVPRGMLALERLPAISTKVVDKFAEHGFDSELGWVRKAGTSKIDYGKPYTIDRYGSRHNPGDHQGGPLIFTYGDSYTFCRECHDNETWQYFLADRLKSRVQNFGVGNYGFDQSLLRLLREYPRNPAQIVIIGIVPQTIGRILSVWKHFNEYGNLLAFKPSFFLDNGRLHLRPNFVDSIDRYFELETYIEPVKAADYFYHHRFIQESFRFPFLVSALLNTRRMVFILLRMLRRLLTQLKQRSLAARLDYWIIMAGNTEGALQTADLYANQSATDLFQAQIEEFKRISEDDGFFPVLLFLPMPDDLLLIRKRGHMYAGFIEQIRDTLPVLDMTPHFLAHPEPHSLFYSSHYSRIGNTLAAARLEDFLRSQNLLSGDLDAYEA